MTTIRLYGEMGRRFGRAHRFALDTNSPAEAVRALVSQFPAVRGYLMGAKDRGVGFAVFRGKENLEKEQLLEPVGDDDIRIAPVVMGRKNGGIVKIVLGVALIVVASIATSGYATFAASSVWDAVATAGYAMALNGVVQLLTPMPRAGKPGDKPDNQASYVFNGPVNTQAQGNPVPLLYGRMIVGSSVISAGINAETYIPATAGVDTGHDDGHGGNWNPKTPYEPEPLT